MGGGGLLIFYVANVANVANVIQVHFVLFWDTFCLILIHSFPRKSRTFVPNFKARWNYANYSNNENNENYEKLRKQRKRIQTTMSLPIFRQRNQSIKAEFNPLLRSRMPTMLIYAKIAAEHGISEDRVRKIIRSP